MKAKQALQSKLPSGLETYLNKLKTFLGEKDPIKVQASTIKMLTKLIDGLSTRELSYKPAPNKWSIRDIVGHLADGEMVFAYRYRKILAEDKPAIDGYDQDLFAENLRKTNEPFRESLERFKNFREINLKLIRRTPKTDWERHGIHAERGAESFGKIVGLLAGHDLNHLQQIATLRAGLISKRK
jgi:hypothetical protein